MKKKTLEEVIRNAKKVHGDFYLYNKINEYNGCNAINIITCPIHGDFPQTFYNHVNLKCGCPICGHKKSDDKRRLPKEEVIRRIKEIGYELAEDFKYVSVCKTKVKLICPKHGEFSILLSNLFKGGRCKNCSFEKVSEKQMLSNDEFKKRLHDLYGDKLDTSKTVYKGEKSKVIVKCRKHGEFKATAEALYLGICCNECKKETLANLKRKSQEQFLLESKSVYGDELMMDKAVYVDENTPILIGCKVHGYIHQTPRVHLKGNGCPLCQKSKLERETEIFLKERNFKFTQEKKVPNSLLRLDFYLEDYNIAIECQGKQHFEQIEYFGGKDGFNKRNERDKRKKKVCDENGIKICYYTNDETYNEFLGEKVFHNLDALIESITSK